MIEIDSAEEFFALQSNIKRIPFTQSKGWHDYQLNNNQSFKYFVDHKKHVKIAIWGKEQKIPLSGKKILLINGETLSKEVNEKVIKAFYSSLLNIPYAGIEINSNNEYDIEFEIGLRRAGFVRPIGLFSCPLTIDFEFQENFVFNRNWKRNIKKAVEAELVFEEKKNITTDTAVQVVSMFRELSKLKNLSYTLEKDNTLTLLNSPDMRTFLVYDSKGKPVAARIIHDNKPFASDVYAANSLQARDCGATYFIMQRIFEQLKIEGYQKFDFGRIPPSNHASDNVYDFKNASRGKKIQYNGEWVFYTNKNIEIAMFFYKLFKLKKQRY